MVDMFSKMGRRRYSGAHTKGDEVTFVEPDNTLVSGDVVQNKIVPAIFGDGGHPRAGSPLVDKIAALKKRGVPAVDAAKQLNAELKAKYPDWPNMSVGRFVQNRAPM